MPEAARQASREQVRKLVLVPRHPVGRYGIGRLSEWGSSITIVALGATALLNPSAPELVAFNILFGGPHNISWWLSSVAVVIVGVVRAAALALNGRLGSHGPKIRFAGSLGCTLFWMELAGSLIVFSVGVGRFSVGGTYLALSIVDVVSCYRASLDARVV